VKDVHIVFTCCSQYAHSQDDHSSYRNAHSQDDHIYYRNVHAIAAVAAAGLQDVIDDASSA
jgi:hypothetical protein